VNGETTYLTAAEMKQVGKELAKVMLRYSGRLADPGARPRGAREVRLFTALTVAPLSQPRRER
jgi:hypothetical protein